MSRATDELLDLLHGTVAQELLDQINRYKNGEVVDGEGVRQPLPASLVAQAIKFLKDNGIDMPARKSTRLDPLADLLSDEETYTGNVARFPKP